MATMEPARLRCRETREGGVEYRRMLSSLQRYARAHALPSRMLSPIPAPPLPTGQLLIGMIPPHLKCYGNHRCRRRRRRRSLLQSEDVRD